MPVINKEPLFVDKINDILTTAFGNKIEGNIRYALGVDDSWLTTDNYLDLISKKRWFGRYPIGKFLERD
ncbi:MAG: hypothetical protein U9P44_01070, partial [archaeon]|nr:hypothetical protein [archaeon]